MLEKKVVELADQLEAALKTAAPEVIESTSKALLAIGLVNLLATAAVGIGGVLLGRCLWKRAVDADYVDSDMWYLGAGASYLIGVVTFIAGWTCVYNWLAVFNQKAWLALKLIDKVGG
jgi:hypothetical protein